MSKKTTEDIDKLMQLLTKDAIYIPKKVLKRDDIYEETKIMFSIILTENQKLINSSNYFPLLKIIDEYKKTDISRIECECFCGEPKAKLIKAEMLNLAEQLEELLNVPLEHRSRGENKK